MHPPIYKLRPDHGVGVGVASTRGQYFLSPHRTIMRDLKLGTWPRKKNGTALAWQTAKKQNSMYKSLSPSVLCCRVRAGRLAADPAAYGVKGAGLLPILLEETLGDLRAGGEGAGSSAAAAAALASAAAFDAAAAAALAFAPGS